MNLSLTSVLVVALLLFIQVLAALPWVLLAFFQPEEYLGVFRSLWSQWKGRRRIISLWGIRAALGLLAALVVLPLLVVNAVQERGALEVCGYVYAVVLQLQLLVDFFIVAFAVLLWVWPKGGAVALAAFREGVRQSMFWLLFALALLLLTLSPFIPYYTFGDDHLVVKDIGTDTIMLAAVIFGALAASLFVSDEIEGRTAVTLMSKPVSRRQFLLGKFAGIVLAALVLFALLGTYFEGVQLFKPWWDKMDKPWWMQENAAAAAVTPEQTEAPPWLSATLKYWDLPSVTTDLLRGVGLWAHLTLTTAPALILAFSQVMVLVAIAVSLATRVPMVVNLTAVLVVYVLAHLTPVLATIAEGRRTSDPNSTVSQLLVFVVKVFDTILPDLGSFRIDPALLGDAPPPPLPFAHYIGSVSLYGVLYTGIALLFGLILFEDRDLA
jgi:hypothetical protein